MRDAMEWPVSDLRLDLQNPRLQTGEEDGAVNSERELIQILADIAALDELVLSICTNTYLNLEPLIVFGPKHGPFTVIEGNRRLAAIRLIQDPELAEEVGVRVPKPVSQATLNSIRRVLVYRVRGHDDAREFIGFKHINGPQRWDAYAKAKYVANWYKQADGAITISQIADKMGDNNNTLRAYIYAVLILEQAEKAGKWSMANRPPTRGRFAFSHLYTALQRVEYQDFLGLTGWSDSPPANPIKARHLNNLAEVLGYLYGDVTVGRQPLIRSQNPDLKNLGLAIADKRARLALQNGADLDRAFDLTKEPTTAFRDALVQAKVKLDRAISVMPSYSAGSASIDELINEIWEQADTLKTMNERKRTRSKH